MTPSSKLSWGSQLTSESELRDRKSPSHLDSQDVLNSFMLKAGIATEDELRLQMAKSEGESSTRAPTPTKPVPGVPPHLWHLHQHKLKDSFPVKIPDPAQPKCPLAEAVGSRLPRLASSTNPTTIQLGRKRSENDAWNHVPVNGSNTGKQWSQTWADTLHGRISATPTIEQTQDVLALPQTLFAESGRCVPGNFNGAYEPPPVSLLRPSQGDFAVTEWLGHGEFSAKGVSMASPSGPDIATNALHHQAPTKAAAWNSYDTTYWEKPVKSHSHPSRQSSCSNDASGWDLQDMKSWHKPVTNLQAPSSSPKNRLAPDTSADTKPSNRSKSASHGACSQLPDAARHSERQNIATESVESGVPEASGGRGHNRTQPTYQTIHPARKFAPLEAHNLSKHAVISPTPVQHKVIVYDSRQPQQPPSRTTGKPTGLLTSRHAPGGIASNGIRRRESTKQPHSAVSELRRMPEPVKAHEHGYAAKGSQKKGSVKAPRLEIATDCTEPDTERKIKKEKPLWEGVSFTNTNQLSRHGIGFDTDYGTGQQEARITSTPYHGRIPPPHQFFMPAGDAKDTSFNEKVTQSSQKSLLQESPKLTEAFDRAAYYQNKPAPFSKVPSVNSSKNSSEYGPEESTGGWESDEDDFGRNRSATHKMVCAWLQICDEPPRPAFLKQHISEHWLCDVDTGTGILMAPVGVPDTMIDPADLAINTPEEMAADFRRRNYNSSLVAAKMRGGLNQMMNSFLDERPPKQVTASSPAKDKPTAHHVPMVVTNIEPPKPKPPKDPFAPGVFCYFRPARNDDGDGICQIYNWEIRHGSQARDTLQLSNDAFQRILIDSQNNDMPFIVAVETSPTSSPTNPDIKRQDQSDYAPMENVIGFAYLAPWDVGIAGCMQGSSRFTARLHVFVRSGYRRNNIGCCLLDKVLSVVSAKYEPKFRYNFIDPDTKPEYCRVSHGVKRRHPFYTLFIHYFLKCEGQDVDSDDPRHFDEAEGDEDLNWLQPLLEERFPFSLMPTRYSYVVRTVERTRRRPAWYDMVVFEHKCHKDPDSIFE